MVPSLLLVDLDHGVLPWLPSALSALGATSEWVQTATEALARMQSKPYRLVLCRYPLPDLTTASFLRVIRQPSALCRDTALLVLAPDAMQEEARAQVREGPFMVVSLGDAPAVVNAALVQLYRLEPRRPVELPVRLSADVDGAPVTLDGQTVNVSLSGMLVDSAPPLPVATRCRFELPDLAVGGDAEVMRHCRPPRERRRGFAVRFLSLEPGAQELLAQRLRG